MANIEQMVAGLKKGAKRGKRGIVAAVLTEDGVVKGTDKVCVSGGHGNDQLEDYHSEMSVVLPAIVETARLENRPPVLIIDNAPYHNRVIDKPPSMSSPKQRLLDWLT